MNETEVLVTIAIICIIGCLAASFGYVNYIRRIRGEPIYCQCIENSPRIHYQSIDTSKEPSTPSPIHV